MYIIADIGGSKTRISLTEDLKYFANPIVVDTPKNYHEGLRIIEESVSQILTGQKIAGIGIGVAGTLSEENDRLVAAPHLEDWENNLLEKDLNRIFETKHTYLENDTALVGLGESIYGAGKDAKILVYVTVSTGVGGVKIENKRIDDSTFGFEPGHQIISTENNLNATLEQLVSGSGIKKRFGVEPIELDDSDEWDRITEYLAIGLHNVVMHWSPDVIVLGGGIALSGKINFQKLTESFQEKTAFLPKLPEIRKASLGDFGGLYGAMELIKEKKI